MPHWVERFCYRDRTEAGEVLAREVALWLKLNPDPVAAPVVIALPRGGIPVAIPVARLLGVPLDILLVRKIGTPREPELAAGAVAEGSFREAPVTVRNDSVIAESGMDAGVFAALRRAELSIIEARRKSWLRNRHPVRVMGQTAILVDDGLATGATARAAIAAVKARGAVRIVLAVPVGAPDPLRAIGREVDAVICPMQPADFSAVGRHYLDFGQVDDAMVTQVLEASHA